MIEVKILTEMSPEELHAEIMLIREKRESLRLLSTSEKQSEKPKKSEKKKKSSTHATEETSKSVGALIDRIRSGEMNMDSLDLMFKNLAAGYDNANQEQKASSLSNTIDGS